MSSRRIGNQEPRIRLAPDYEYSDGEDASMFASAYGLTPDEWQKNILIDWLGRGKDDKFTASSCGLSVPRQNGKNAILEMFELYHLAVIGSHIMHTAHRVDTSCNSFVRLASFFEDERYPELLDLKKKIRRTNGQEGIVLKNGGEIRFSSRVNGSGRGFTSDVIIFDEAQELTEDYIEALIPTLSAAPLGNRQLIYTGTPTPPSSRGTVFSRERNRVIKEKEDKCCWHEWSVEEIGDVKDRDRWYETNPGLGIRLDEEFTDTECKKMNDDSFARERLGWWCENQVEDAALNATKWKECAIESAPQKENDEKLAFGVKFSADGTRYSISAAIKPKDDIPYIELIQDALIIGGVTNLADLITRHKNELSTVVIDGMSNTATLYQKLIDNGFKQKTLLISNTRTISDAAVMIKNAIDAKELHHYNQDKLTDSAVGTVKRPIGKTGGWGFGVGAELSEPIESASLAYYGLMKAKYNPRRKQRIG